MKFLITLIFTLSLVATAFGSTSTGYEYDAEYSKPDLVCTNTSHYDATGAFTGYSISCEQIRTLEKLVEKSACFPGDAMVELESHKFIPMYELSVGDVVRTDQDTYEPVINWLHFEPDAMMETVCLFTHNHEVCASVDHYIWAGSELKRFDDVSIGDVFTTADGNFEVTHVTYKIKHGVYAPATTSGNIMVNQVMASTYAYIAPSTFAQGILNRLLEQLPFDQCNVEGIHCAGYMAMQVYIWLNTAVQHFQCTLSDC